MSSDGVNMYGLEVLAFFFLFFWYIISGVMIEHHKIKFMHESGLIIVISLFFGTIFYLNGVYIEFSEHYFFYLILPPIIFAGGFNLQKRLFFANIEYIMLYGLFGTIINFVVMAGLTFIIDHMDLIVLTKSHSINEYFDGQVIHLHASEILQFSAIICATDSVAALTLIKSKEHPKLFSVIFGEGMINDAVSIILFQCVSMVYREVHDERDAFQIGQLLQKIFHVSVYSIVLGVIGGIVPALLFKKLRKNHYEVPPNVEICMCLFFGHFTYMICEHSGLSGILSILLCGVIMSHYAFYNLTSVSQKSMGLILNVFAFFAEGFLFIYLGLSSIIRQSDWSLSFFLSTLIAIFIARFCSVFGSSFLAKKWYFDTWELDTPEIWIVYFAGLIRGAIAFGLVVTLKTQNGSLIITNTLLLVLVTTIVLGGLLSFIINYFIKIKMQRQMHEDKYGKLSEIKKNSDLRESDNNMETTYGWFNKLDEQFIRPYLIYNYYQRHEELEAIDKQEEEDDDGDPRMRKFHGTIRQDKKLLEQQIKKSQIRHSQQNRLHHENEMQTILHQQQLKNIKEDFDNEENDDNEEKKKHRT